MGGETVPEIRRCNLSNTVLTLKALDIEDVIGFDFIDRPSQKQMEEVCLFFFLFFIGQMLMIRNELYRDWYCCINSER